MTNERSECTGDKRSTGYFDRHGTMIREGDHLRTGMRRNDPKGWTTEKVVWSAWNKTWLLADLKTKEKMQFQYDQELREIV